MGKPILIADGLQMVFPSQHGALEAVAEASFEVMPNEFLCIIGPSGCGKSTLLRILAGLVRPTAGEVRLNGAFPRDARDRIGFVFQHANLMPWRSTLENVLLPLQIRGTPAEEREAKARAVLQRVGLQDFAGMWPRDLSGGMRQRVGLARALVQDPDLLLLDEPFGALDALTRERMGCELLQIWEQDRKTVIMVTHDIQEAVLLSDRVLTMSSAPGRIECEIPIDLPRPRSMEDLYEPHFVELVHALRDTLR
jgi:NitT/TauT family transport system ATP-binding protein